MQALELGKCRRWSWVQTGDEGEEGRWADHTYPPTLNPHIWCLASQRALTTCHLAWWRLLLLALAYVLLLLLLLLVAAVTADIAGGCCNFW